MSNKIPLIYILSNGRSGTTILDMLLGTHPNIWTTGETQILPWETKDYYSPCGCGKRVENCKFWKAIIPEVDELNQIFPIHYFREVATGGKVLRYQLLYELYFKRANKNIGKYGKANYKLFETILKRASDFQTEKIRYLVDASMDLYRLLWLQRSDFFDIKVIHLIKDPRAFVYSMTKNKKQKLGLRKTIRMALRWKIENSLMEKFSRNYFEEENIRIQSYESMAEFPQDTMREIFDWLILEDYQVTEEFRYKEQHAISGNKARWEEKEIYLDEKWKVQMPKTNKLITNILT